MKYKVGQILFVVPHKKTAVVAVQIIEEITKKSLKGEQVSYIVRYGSDPNDMVDINEIDGEIFDSSKIVKKILIEKSTKALNQLVDNAIKKAKNWYDDAFENPVNSSSELESVLTKGTVSSINQKSQQKESNLIEDSNSTIATIKLEDGSTAKVKLPPSFQG